MGYTKRKKIIKEKICLYDIMLVPHITNQPHGNHAGDFPVLFSNNGVARMCFFTNKFKVADIIGKAVVIHQSPDDYRTQPAGDAGKRLACGVIKENLQ